MAQIDFPDVPMARFDIQANVPNVIRHSSIYGSSEQVFARATLSFSGHIIWPRYAYGQHPEYIAEITAFLARCYGPVNTFDVPLPGNQQKRFSDTTALTIANLASDTFESSFTATEGLLAGDYVNFSHRLHQITFADKGNYKCVPAVKKGETEMAWHSPKMRCRLAQSSVEQKREGVWAGPYEIEVVEAV